MNNTAFVRRLTLLNARIPTVEFIAQQDEDTPAEKAAKAAAVAAGAGAAGYAGLSYLRGRQWQKKVTGAAPSTLGEHLGAVRAGNQMNLIAARGALRGASANTSAFVQGSKEKFALAANAAKSTAAEAAKTAGTAVTGAVKTATTATAPAVAKVGAALQKWKLRVAK